MRWCAMAEVHGLGARLGWLYDDATIMIHDFFCFECCIKCEAPNGLGLSLLPDAFTIQSLNAFRQAQVYFCDLLRRIYNRSQY